MEKENKAKQQKTDEATSVPAPAPPSPLPEDKPITVKDLKLPEVKAAIMPMKVEVFDSTFFLPWYFHDGLRRPAPARISRRSKKRLARIFPSEDAFIDRITNQLMFVPPDYGTAGAANKTILLYDGLEPWAVKSEGASLFQELECPVDTCSITSDRTLLGKADLIFFKDKYEPISAPRSPDQVYALHWRDSPPYANLPETPNLFNWTSTYR